MKDSRIGSYGALALALGLGLRATGLAAAPDACTGAAALLALGAASRAGLPAAMVLLAPPPESNRPRSGPPSRSARRRCC